jgi:hypothetical protein
MLYKIIVEGEHPLLERKLEKYLTRKTANERTESGVQKVTLTNGSNVQITRKEGILEMLLSSTDTYFNRAVKSISRYVPAENLSFQEI